MKIINLEQRSPEWLRWRSKGIGSSDIAAIMGKSPYKTRRQLWIEKHSGKAIEEIGKEFIFDQGKRLEEIAKRDLKELYGVEMEPICAESSENERYLASVDLFHKDYGGAEVKYIGYEKFQAVLNDKIVPEDHYIQCNWQMFVCDIESWIYFCGTPSKEATLLTIKRDDELIKVMKDEAGDFMDSLKEGSIPPITNKDWLEPNNPELFELLRRSRAVIEASEFSFEQIKERIINTYQHNKIKCAGVKVYQDVSGKWIVKIDKKEGEAVNG